MDFKTNYFDLFGLPQSYVINEISLRSTHHALLQEVHPDRFVSHAPQEQRIATQYTVFINTAFDTLLSPVKRAIYLLNELGVEINFEYHTIKDISFLVEQMSFREQLESAKQDRQQLEKLKQSAKKQYRDIIHQLENVFSSFSEEKKETAIHLVLRLKFFERLLNSAFD